MCTKAARHRLAVTSSDVCIYPAFDGLLGIWISIGWWCFPGCCLRRLSSWLLSGIDCSFLSLADGVVSCVQLQPTWAAQGLQPQLQKPLLNPPAQLAPILVVLNLLAGMMHHSQGHLLWLIRLQHVCRDIFSSSFEPDVDSTQTTSNSIGLFVSSMLGCSFMHFLRLLDLCVSTELPLWLRYLASRMTQSVLWCSQSCDLYMHHPFGRSWHDTDCAKTFHDICRCCCKPRSPIAKCTHLWWPG